MNIKLFGNGVGENKVVFEKLLAKWDELFTRQGIFDEMECAETEKDGSVTFTSEDTELSFYQTEASKANRIDIAIAASGLGTALSYIAGMKFLHDEDGSERKKLEEPRRNAVIVTDIVYEVYAEKRIAFVFSKFADSNEVILRIEFSDDESDSDLEAKVTATADDESLVSLDALLEELGKGEVVAKFVEFAKQVVERKSELERALQEDAEEERNKALKPAFDALDNL